MAVKTIVVALALDDGSRPIADRAVQLANDHDAQLIGVHVIENPGGPGWPPAVDAEALVAQLKHEGVEHLQTLLKASNRPSLTMVETGKPHAAIEALARSRGADLIIIGPGVAGN